MQLVQFIGDTQPHTVPLAWTGEPFEPDAAWSLIWTAKRSASDDDDSAVIQKATGAGISVTEDKATIELVPYDTIFLPSTQLIWDLQAQSLTSLPIFTSQPGRPIAGKSAYDLAVEGGFNGSETDWLASLVGPQGPAGTPAPNYTFYMQDGDLYMSY